MVKESLADFDMQGDDQQLLVLVGVRSWLVFISLVLIAIGFVIWLFFGTIPITAEGRGVFHQSERGEASDLIYGFFPVEEAQAMEKGMKALIEFDAINAKKYGKINGSVLRVLPFVSSEERQLLVDMPSLEIGTPLSLVEIKLQKGPQGDYQWTNTIGPKPEIVYGRIALVRVFLNEIRPINYLFPHWK